MAREEMNITAKYLKLDIGDAEEALQGGPYLGKANFELGC